MIDKIYLIFIYSLISLTVFYFFYSFTEIKKFFKKIEKKYLYILIAIIFLGFLLRLVTPRFFTTIWDELVYVKNAEEIIRYFEFNNIFFKPILYPAVLSIIFFLTGPMFQSAVYFNTGLSLLSIPLSFFLCYSIFENEKIGLYTSTIFAFLPSFLLYSKTAESNTLSIFLLLSFLISFFIYSKNKNKRILILTFFLLLLTLYSRYENLIVVLLILTIIKIPKLKKKDLLLVVIFILLIIPLIYHIFYTSTSFSYAWTEYKNYENIGKGTTDILSISKTKIGLEQFINSLFILFPFFIFPFSIIGIIKCKKRKLVYFSILFFSLLSLIHILRGLVLIRAMIFASVPIYVLTGYGIHNSEEILSKKIKRKNSFRIIIIILVLIFSSFSYNTMKHEPSIHGYFEPYYSATSQEYRILLNITNKFDNYTVLMSNPIIASGTPLSENSISFKDFKENNKTKKETLYFKDMYCNEKYISIAKSFGFQNEYIEDLEKIIDECNNFEKQNRLTIYKNYTRKVIPYHTDISNYPGENYKTFEFVFYKINQTS